MFTEKAILDLYKWEWSGKKLAAKFHLLNGKTQSNDFLVIHEFSVQILNASDSIQYYFDQEVMEVIHWVNLNKQNVSNDHNLSVAYSQKS